MIEVVDIENSKANYLEQKKKALLYFGGASLLVVLALIFGIIYSPENYLLLMWILIVIATLYIWGTLYFLTVPYKKIRQYCRFYTAASSGLKDNEEVTFLGYQKEKELSKDGLSAQVMKTNFKENGIIYERDFYVIGELPEIKENSKIVVQSFSSVLLAYEVKE